MRGSTNFSKVLRAYCERRPVHPDQVKLVFKGRVVNPDDTPAQVRETLTNVSEMIRELMRIVV